VSSASISGTQKVAAFLLSLDKQVGALVMRSLDSKVVANVAEAMTELSPDLCSPEAVDKLFFELSRTVHTQAGVRPQDKFQLYEILAGTFGPEEADRVIEGIAERRRRAHPLGFLDKVPTDRIVSILTEESPAVVALVMSHASPEASAKVLATYEPEMALDVVRRMTQIVPPNVDTMLTIADDIQRRLRASAGEPAQIDRSDSLRTVAELLNYTKAEIEKVVLEGLESADEEIANEVREYMFAWEDLGTIDKRGMQKILASIDTPTLSIALKASPEDVENNIMSNLSSRVREMVSEEREIAGAVPMTDVIRARDQILKAARGMMESGDLTPARSGEELVS
jgi:flagellar motor switch protein FliG